MMARRSWRLVALATLSTLACGDDEAGRSEREPASGDRGSASAALVAGSALHARHASAVPSVPCVGCHELVDGQYLRAKSWTCQRCHPSEPLAVRPHPFRLRRAPSRRSTAKRASAGAVTTSSPRMLGRSSARPVMPSRKARCRRSRRTTRSTEMSHARPATVRTRSLRSLRSPASRAIASR